MVKLRMCYKERFTQVLIEPLLREGRLKSIKPIHSLFTYSWEVHKSLFNFCTSMICVSHVFVYDAVDINKIVAVSLIKLPSYAYVQVTAWQNLYLGGSTNPW